MGSLNPYYRLLNQKGVPLTGGSFSFLWSSRLVCLSTSFVGFLILMVQDLQACEQSGFLAASGSGRLVYWLIGYRVSGIGYWIKDSSKISATIFDLAMYEIFDLLPLPSILRAFRRWERKRERWISNRYIKNPKCRQGQESF